MPKLATTLLSLALMLTSGIAAAQVDTGGGMGGTGARRQSELIDPAGGNAVKCWNQAARKSSSFICAQAKKSLCLRIVRL